MASKFQLEHGCMAMDDNFLWEKNLGNPDLLLGWFGEIHPIKNDKKK